MPTLAADIARRPEEVRTAFTQGYEEFLQRIIPFLPEDTTAKVNISRKVLYATAK